MDQKKLFKQMIDFQKATFDNSFAALTTMQEQGEKMMTMFIDQAPWLPKEGRKVIRDWIAAYAKGRDDLKQMVEDNFEKVEAYFAGSDEASE